MTIILLIIFATLISPFIISCFWVLSQSSGSKRLSPANAAVVYGAGVKDTGPSYTLINRTLHAAHLYKNNLVQFIFISGSGKDRETDEMLKMLIRENIPKDKIFMDPKGFNTLATVQNFKKLMTKQGWKNAIMVSSKYHLARIRFFCKKNNISYQGSAPESIFFPKLPYFYFRETVALLYYLIF